MRLPTQSAGKDGEMVARAESIEETLGRQPTLAKYQPVTGVTLKQLLEIIDYRLVRAITAAFLNHAMRELPVVVPASAILPVLNFGTRWLVPAEMLDRCLNGGSVGFVHVHQDA